MKLYETNPRFHTPSAGGTPLALGDVIERHTADGRLAETYEVIGWTASKTALRLGSSGNTMTTYWFTTGHLPDNYTLRPRSET